MLKDARHIEVFLLKLLRVFQMRVSLVYSHSMTASTTPTQLTPKGPTRQQGSRPS